MPSSVRSTETLKKLKPLAPGFAPDTNELLQPFAFKTESNEPSPSCPNKCDK